MSKRQMHLGVFVLGTGNHSAGWRWEAAYATSCSFAVMQSIASIAERGKFDLLFISDSVVMDPGDHPSFVNRFEPMTLLAALSVVTRHIGLGATVSTSFSEPFHVARSFASLDHISGGRAAWNVVTSTHNAAALNFSKERLNEHDLRYEIATEFVDVVRGLWDTWDYGAIVADKPTGTFLEILGEKESFPPFSADLARRMTARNFAHPINDIRGLAKDLAVLATAAVNFTNRSWNEVTGSVRRNSRVSSSRSMANSVAEAPRA